jgi:hypothetical protein
MKRKALRFGKGFRVALQNRRVQAAEMVIEPGGAEGGPKNRHRGADQWTTLPRVALEAAARRPRRQLMRSAARFFAQLGRQRWITEPPQSAANNSARK